ncbi:unnamed protein product [marine sediment metagenome]|uniref:Uncharacterized protein n=1 Tax=marine sediment metagenome TaxID=412755 RepID=X0SEG2_9ZZZZ
MNTLSPGGAAKIQGMRNRSIRSVRKRLTTDYKMFIDSKVNPGGIPVDVRGVRLNAKQRTRLETFYIGNIKQAIRDFPYIKGLKAADPVRRQELEDIITLARQDAIDELFFEEPIRQQK